MIDLASSQYQNALNAIETALISESPDEDTLISTIVSQLDLTPADAISTIYSVLIDLHSCYFPPIRNIELTITERCNLNCSYCFEGHHDHPQDMSVATGESAVRFLFDYSQKARSVNILFFGGEPLLNFPLIRHLAEYSVEIAAQRGQDITFSLTSNGTLLTEDMCEVLYRYRIPILLSIDGVEQTHDRSRVDYAGRGTFRSVVRAIHLLRATQHIVGARMTVSPESVKDLFQNVVGLYESGITKFLIGHAVGIKWKQHQIALFKQQLAQVRQWLTTCNDPEAALIGATNDVPSKSWFGCSAARTTIAVSPGGEVYACSMLQGERGGMAGFRLGTLALGLSHLRNRIELCIPSKLKSGCQALGLAENYQGGCFAANYLDGGAIFAPSMQQYLFMGSSPEDFTINDVTDG